jgi:general secretion pathway protein G
MARIIRNVLLGAILLLGAWSLVCMVLPAYWGREHSGRARDIDDLAALARLLRAYKQDVGHFPSQAQGLAALQQRPAGEKRWKGPYTTRPIPNDPWGNPYLYRYEGATDDFKLICSGRDSRLGTEDDTVYSPDGPM